MSDDFILGPWRIDKDSDRAPRGYWAISTAGQRDNSDPECRGNCDHVDFVFVLASGYPRGAATAKIIRAAPVLIDALREAEEVLDRYADAEIVDGRTHGNAAMHALQMVREALMEAGVS